VSPQTDTPTGTPLNAQPAPSPGFGHTPAGLTRVVWVLVSLIVGLDQITKALVRAYVSLHDSIPIVSGVLNLTHVENTGAAFGLLNSADFPFKPVVIAVCAAAALLGIAVYASRLAPEERIARIGLAMILGGAVGNLIDRIVGGAVVDFVDVVIGGWHFWAFNVADSAITLGVVAMFLDMFGLDRHVSTTS
jgi:signal peptidase II